MTIMSYNVSIKYHTPSIGRIFKGAVLFLIYKAVKFCFSSSSQGQKGDRGDKGETVNFIFDLSYISM